MTYKFYAKGGKPKNLNMASRIKLKTLGYNPSELTYKEARRILNKARGG